MAAQPKVFISYAKETKDKAIQLSRVLGSRGVQTWLDVDQLKPGQAWKDEIEKAAGQADSFVILVGPQNTGTAWLESEWQAALKYAWESQDKRMIPVVFGGSDPPPFLQRWVGLNVDASGIGDQWTSPVVNAILEGAVPGGTPVDAIRQRLKAQWMERVSEIEAAARTAPEGAAVEQGPEKLPGDV